MPKSYWWKEKPNFGDALAPYLLKQFSNMDVEWDTISRSSIISVGSILEHVPPLWDGHIIGSGKLFEFSRLHTHTNTAKIWAIRGPLSARGIAGTYALGDPGVLANELIGYQEKKWDLGIVPHWQDTNLEKDTRFINIPKPWTYTIIRPVDNPIEVITKIAQCRKIVTSSLHGMIVADSFGIPRRIEMCPALEKDGGDFKFRDYSSSILLPFETGKLQEASRYRVETLQHELYDAYYSLGREFKCL